MNKKNQTFRINALQATAFLLSAQLLATPAAFANQLFPLTYKGVEFSSSFRNTDSTVVSDPTRLAENSWTVDLHKNITGQKFSAAGLSFREQGWSGKTLPENDPSAENNLVRTLRNSRLAPLAMDLTNGKIAISKLQPSSGLSARKELRSEVRGSAASYSMKPTEGWIFSLSTAYLKESNTLLGSPAGGYIGLGKTTTVSAGLGASVELGGGYRLSADAMAATTSGSRRRSDLVAGTSRLTSFGMGMAVDKADTYVAGDHAVFSVQKPLRVHSGSADFISDDGAGGFETTEADLKPSGSETRFAVDYKRAIDLGGTAQFRVAYRSDADHIAGQSDISAMFRFVAGF